MKIFESGALKECIISWGNSWIVCKDHKEGDSGSEYGGCRYWVYTDFYEDDDGVEVRHPGYCKRKEKFEEILNKELFEI